MAEDTDSSRLIDERAYLATRVLLTAFAWLLIAAGRATDTLELASPLIVSGALAATVVTAGVAFALIVSSVRFDRVLVWAAPADLAVLALFIPALHDFGDPVLAVVVAFVAFYGHILTRWPATFVTVVAAAVYSVAHVIAHEPIQWHVAMLLGMKACVVVFVGALSALLNERYHEREHQYREAMHERGALAEELHQRVDELQAISDLTSIIHSSLEVEHAAPSIMKILGLALGVERATLIVMDKRSGDTLFRGTHGVSGFPADAPRDLADLESPGPDDQVLLAGRHMSCRSVFEHQRFAVLFCADPDALERLGERGLAVLGAVCSALVVAVENSQLYELTLRLAITDELTGLNNYRYFQQRLDEEVERSRRYHNDVSLLMIDADNFKGFNDSYGHVAGDVALANIGRLLRDAVREVDVVARYGGEEFAVILPETGGAGAFVAAEKIRESIAAFEFLDADGNRGPRLSVSIGLASFPEHAEDKGALLRHADEALYQAKNFGKNRVRSATALHRRSRGDASKTRGDDE